MTQLKAPLTEQPDAGDRERVTSVSPAAKFLRLVVHHWKFLLGSVLATTATSVAVSFLLPNWYEATVSAVPPSRTTPGLESVLGAAVGALRDIGALRLGTLGQQGYNFLVILESRRLKDSLIERFRLWELYDLPDTARHRLYRKLERDLGVTYELNGNYTVTARHTDPHQAAAMANAAIEIANAIAAEVNQHESGQLRQYLETRLARLDSTIAQIADSLRLFSRQTLVFSPLDQAQAAARALAELKAHAMSQQILLEALRHAYGSEDPAVRAQQQLLGGVQHLVRRAEQQPGLIGDFPLREAAGVGLRFLRLYAELETYQRVRGLLLPVVEQTRLDEQRSRPVLYVVDPAVAPQLKAYPKRILIALGSMVGSLVLSLLLLLLWQRWREWRPFVQNGTHSTGEPG
ncbi:MAG: hypothetical protein NZ473_01815 [Candidatus Kapabacteria bacterium]|nr:hypothetical protein [Candidatus Kapabacteria bacterium]MCS7170427.1 hypothetical protein [Candidatus Kapabacteria bacterium]MDW7997278.1 hypothetical protein [Bacteroidota bacterium]MDW8224445.1 hypothetical protein [Bacteroidota bacterium]